MRALRVHEFGEPEVLREEELEDPVAGPGQVLVRVQAAGVNPVDTYVRAGLYERLPPLPYIPGGDGAGTVLALGEGVSRWLVGDRVYVAGAVGGTLTGCHATRVVRDEDQVHPLPRRVSFEQGAAVGVPYATAYRALVQLAKAKPGERLLVHGASGSVGLAAVQLAKARGLRVAGTASSQTGRQLVQEQGAELVVDHSQDGYREELADWSQDRGMDLILEMAAHVNLDADLDLARRGGQIVIIGCRGPVTIHPRKAMVKDLMVRAFALANASPQEMSEIHRALVEGMECGELQPVVARVYPLRDGAAAHRAISDPASPPGKVVIRTDDAQPSADADQEPD